MTDEGGRLCQYWLRGNHNYDVMGQNQSQIAQYKIAEICILSENVKICPFFVFIKNKIVHVSVT